jgi:hypothetical protein
VGVGSKTDSRWKVYQVWVGVPGDPARARAAVPAAEVLGGAVSVVLVIGVVIPDYLSGVGVVTLAGKWQLGGDPAAVSRRSGPGGRQPVARESRPPLSDRGELSARQFRVNQEAEWIRPLALLHQPDQNRLPELS